MIVSEMMSGRLTDRFGTLIVYGSFDENIVCCWRSPLNRSPLCIIIRLTISPPDVSGRNDAPAQARDRQTVRFTARRYAQSSPSGCAPFFVSWRRLFRSGRSGSGQVRNASAGPCRQPADFSSCARICSPSSFYQANASFAEAGLVGLSPLKRGPKGGHKLTPAVMEFIVAKQKAESALSFAQLAELAQQEFDIQVHPRSIARQLLREKKRR